SKPSSTTMKHKGAIALIAVVVIVVAGIGYYNLPLLQQANVAPGAQTQTCPDGSVISASAICPQLGSQPYAGDLAIKVTISDGASPATAYTDATNVKLQYFYKSASGAYVNPVTSASNSATVTVGPST